MDVVALESSIALSHREKNMAAIVHMPLPSSANIRTIIKGCRFSAFGLPVDGLENILAFLHTTTTKKTIPGANDPIQYWRLFSFPLFLASPINPAARITSFGAIYSRETKDIKGRYQMPF